ncbi:MAG: hypothetical protein GWP05_01915 [Anaerolineaceae bacterium]|nr:hypothetical protein [Anaerolineaceae bacterium]
MKSSLRSFPARLLAIVLALPVLSAAAVAQDEQDPLLIHFGFSGRARNNCWTPVLIESALNLTFQGRASIYASETGSIERGRFSTPLTLTASGSEGERERFWLYVRPEQGDFRVTAQLRGTQDVRLFEKRPMGPLRCSTGTKVFLVASLPSGRPIGLQQELLKAYLLDDKSKYMPYAYDYEVIQARAIGYDGIDTLLLLNPRMDRDLREDQSEAIMKFVETGGRLVIFVNRYWQQTSRSRLAEILPAQFGPLVKLADTSRLRQLCGPWTPEFEGDLFVPAMQPKGPTARVLVTCGNRPVVLAGTVGMGSVTLVGLDTDSAVLQSWPKLPQLAARLQELKRGLTPRPPPEENTTEHGFMVGERAEQFIASASWFGSVAFVWAIILMTLGYIFVAGPLLHLVLRGMKRLRWSWPVYMALSLAAAGASFLVTSAFRNRDTVCRTMTVVDFPADSRAAVGRSNYSVRFPDSSLYEVSLDTRQEASHYVRQGWITLAPTDRGGLGMLPSSGKLFDYAPTLLSLDRLAVKSNQSRNFTSQWRSDLARPFFADLRREGGQLRGTLRNTVGKVKLATLFGPSKTYVIRPDLEPGGAVRLEGRGKSTATYLQSLANNIIDQNRGMLSAPVGPSEAHPRKLREWIFQDICLSSFYEFYRRSPVKERDDGNNKQRYLISRNDASRRLDLSHVLDSGQAVLIGVAQIDLPDALIIDGREVVAQAEDRLVVFRQVVPIK